MAPIIVHSSDGLNWSSSALPAGSDSALLNSVVEHDGRFVITGATNVWTDPTTARPAAWYSDDGINWLRATVEASASNLADHAELGPLWAGDDGLFACSGSRFMTAGGWRFMDGWVSADGAVWQHAAWQYEGAPGPGPHVGCDWSSSDGTRIVALGPRGHATPWEWPGITSAWMSTDGRTWQELTVSATLPDMLERFWVVPDGVIYAGEQSFWFGTAVGR